MINRIAALILLIILSPFFIFIAIAIFIEDGIPVFFSQKRISIDYKYFYI